MLHRKLPARCVLFVTLLVAACSGGSDRVIAPPVAPNITVNGVQNGMIYQSAVTVDIVVDRGSYVATLNGAPFTTGHIVSAPGDYVLQIDARNGDATTSRTVQFSIAAAPGLTIIRLINLGANDSGGGGDAILITDSAGGRQYSGLVDAGPAGADGSDAGYVARRLQELGVDTLDFLMLSHAHGDHYLGMNSVLTSKKVRRFFYNGQVRSLSSYQSVLSTARSRVGNDSVTVPTSILNYVLGRDSALHLTIIPPLPTYLAMDTDDGTQLNEGSLGMLLQRGSFDMFFTGDGEVEATRRWRTDYGQYNANIEVLKVGHHGANNAIFDNGFNGTSSWLAHTAPQVSVISANGTTHPRVNALTALLGRTNMRTYCTNVHGEISIRVQSSGTYTVTVEKNADKDCVPGSQADT